MSALRQLICRMEDKIPFCSCLIAISARCSKTRIVVSYCNNKGLQIYVSKYANDIAVFLDVLSKERTSRTVEMLLKYFVVCAVTQPSLERIHSTWILWVQCNNTTNASCTKSLASPAVFLEQHGNTSNASCTTLLDFTKRCIRVFVNIDIVFLWITRCFWRSYYVVFYEYFLFPKSKWSNAWFCRNRTSFLFH